LTPCKWTPAPPASGAAHDLFLIDLARSGAIENKKEHVKSLNHIERLIERHPLPENEVENFNKIINSMKTA